MKKLLSIALAALMLICAMTVVASAAADDVAVAAPATGYIPAADGIKDDVYDQSTPLVIGEEGDDIYAKAYFAYDNEYLYVFVEVKDATIPAPASGNITPATSTDSVMVCINLLNQTSNTAVWNPSAVSEKNYWAGIYGAMRTASNSNQVWEGGHAHLNKGYKAVAVSEDDGYVAEMKIPFGVDMDGNAYDVATLFETGISVEFAIADADTDHEALKENEPDIIWYLSSGADKMRMRDHQPFDSSDAIRMNKLEFTAGEFGADRIEVTTAAPTTPAITTPTIVTVAPIITPIVTPAVTTPEETTPAATTPEVTTPEKTTPAATTPEETAPAATTPAETTAPVVEPGTASSAPVGLIIGIVVAVLVVAAVVVVVLKKKGNKA